MPREKRPEERVVLRLEISVGHRDRLMIAAAKQGRSMAACVREVVQDWVDAHEPVQAAPKPRKRKEKPE